MLFIIDEVSAYCEEKPCEEAFKKECEFWHTRTCTEKEFNKKFSDREGLWRSKGIRHRVTKKGFITRLEGCKLYWCIEIDSLKELEFFINKYEITFYRDYANKENHIKIEDVYND